MMLRRVVAWVSMRPETTAWIAAVVTLILLLELGEHVMRWW